MNTHQPTSFDEHIDKPFIDPISQTFRRTILLSILTLLLTIIVLWWIRRRQQRFAHHGKCLLLCGIAKSGKTLLFNRLTSNLEKRPFYAMSVNHGTMKLDYLSSDRPIEKVHVIEIPSNTRHYQYDFLVYKTSAKAIIFVIDSTTIEKDLKYVSDYLYHIIRERYFRDQHLPLLIFCNKQDINKTDHSIQRIRYLLERELTSKQQIQEDIGQLGKETFEFSDVKDIRIEFAEGSTIDTKKDGEGSHLLKVHQWIARIWFK
ncbi:unnamed protein product [Adineta ricciae]|uniref:Signal recognition particle receptor subunit beta n=1 Tax=Adineta ricciae TaxID=249248 RepID=A0A814V0R8_ADIRI|nr:unnamed protein product [Adineta ricciae]CAF1180420.1 unnamed protein product [Adineta ricciae]